MSDEECLNPSKRRKIEETVSQILKTLDLEATNELSVRTTVSERLGLELSGVPYHPFVQQLVDSFLHFIATEILNAKSSHQKNDDNNVKQINGGIMVQHEKKHQQQQSRGRGVELSHKYNGKVFCKLSDKRMVTTYRVNGRTVVSIRDFYIEDGNMLPKTGINLTPKEWSSFRSCFPSIEEAIAKLESQIRSEAAVKQSKAAMTNSVADSAVCNYQSEASIFNFTTTVQPIEKRQTEATSRSVIDSTFQEHSITEKTQVEAGTFGLISTSNSQKHIPAERKLDESDISASASAFPTQDNAFHPKQLIPVQTTRLDGRNYHSWKHHMQLFLKQFNLAYVLVEPCPNVSLNSEISSEEKVKIKAAVQRWIYDDCVCCDNILKSLCDGLFQWYSHKSYSAKELWEELKLVYDEDFGTKSSQINKYIHFQMVDGVCIFEQVKELDKIANSIIASDVWIDESFHVSVIISKLPPSWKEFRYMLMHEEILSFRVLLHRLQVEEESRNCHEKENTHKKGKGHTMEPKLDNRFGIRKKENRRVCYSCGKEGHIAKFCPNRKFEAFEKSIEKETGIHSLHTGTDNMVEAANNK